MQDKVESIVREVYGKWKRSSSAAVQAHPDEETLAVFLEGRLAPQEQEELEAHLTVCRSCAELASLQIKTKMAPQRKVPPELVRWAKGLFAQAQKSPSLAIALRIKGMVLELLSTTGDILLGQELLPAPVLRSRQIKDFKDEVTILKDFAQIRVEIKIANKPDHSFDAAVLLKDKKTGLPLKDLRVSLIKDDTELESYIVKAGTVIFEHVILGKYIIEITSIDDKLASVLLDVRK